MNLLTFLHFCFNTLKIQISDSISILTYPKFKLLILKGQYGFVIFHYTVLNYIINSSLISIKNFFKNLLISIFYKLSVKHKKLLLMKGVGFRFELKKTKIKKITYLRLKAGYNSPIIFKYNNKLFNFKTPKQNRLLIKGLNLNKLYLFLLAIKKYRIPDVYKNKGIRFRFEKLIKKEVKKSK